MCRSAARWRLQSGSHVRSPDDRGVTVWGMVTRSQDESSRSVREYVRTTCASRLSTTPGLGISPPNSQPMSNLTRCVLVAVELARCSFTSISPTFYVGRFKIGFLTQVTRLKLSKSSRCEPALPLGGLTTCRGARPRDRPTRIGRTVSGSEVTVMPPQKSCTHSMAAPNMPSKSPGHRG